MIFPKPKPIYKNSSHFVNFWKYGNGKALIHLSGAIVNFYQFDDFAPYFYQVDDLGDAVVQDIYFKKNYREASAEIQHYVSHGVSADDEIPNSVKNLLLQTQTIPHWLDKNLLKLGVELCMRCNVDSLIALRDYCLIGGYDYRYLSKPLIATEALKKGAVKRLSDTLNFWVHVTRYDGLEIHAKGYEMAIKTRLIHSYARLNIQKNFPQWDAESRGAPLNSWDMMATYIGFSLIFFHGLQKLGNKVSAEEEKGLFHLWKYIGYLLGIPEKLLPDNAKSATELFYLWTAVQPPADEESVLLAHSLLNESLENKILKYHFQRKNLRYLHICCTWFLLDHEVCRRLQIPEVPLKNAFPKSKIAFNQIYSKLWSRNARIRIGDKGQRKVLADYMSII